MLGNASRGSDRRAPILEGKRQSGCQKVILWYKWHAQTVTGVCVPGRKMGIGKVVPVTSSQSVCLASMKSSRQRRLLQAAFWRQLRDESTFFSNQARILPYNQHFRTTVFASLVSPCQGLPTFTSFHCHVGAFAAATAPCMIPTDAQSSAICTSPIAVMARLFDPKNARLVSVIAATVIALACGTNVSRQFSGRSID